MLEPFKVRKPWTAAVIAFFDPFVGMLYLGRGLFAILYFAAEIVALFLFLYMLPQGSEGSFAPSALGLVVLPIRLTGMVHAFVIAQRRTPGAPPQWYARWYALILIALLVPMGTVMFKGYFFGAFSIVDPSMAPTLNPDDNIVVSQHAYDFSDPARGDVVLFGLPAPGGAIVGRVVGLPGDRIQMKNGILFVNDVAVPKRHSLGHDYVETLPGGRSYHVLDLQPSGPGDNTPVHSVPAGHYFVLGDNRDDTYDSRSSLGPIAKGTILGRVVMKSLDAAKRKAVLQAVQ